MAYIVNFLIDPNEKTCGCWVVKADAPDVIIEASWCGDYRKSKFSWTVQPFAHDDLLLALEFFWEITREFGWKHLDYKQLCELEKLWFDSEKRH